MAIFSQRSHNRIKFQGKIYSPHWFRPSYPIRRKWQCRKLKTDLLGCQNVVNRDHGWGHKKWLKNNFGKKLDKIRTRGLLWGGVHFPQYFKCKFVKIGHAQSRFMKGLGHVRSPYVVVFANFSSCLWEKLKKLAWQQEPEVGLLLQNSDFRYIFEQRFIDSHFVRYLPQGSINHPSWLCH